jgi:hypothetical protein
MDDEDLARHPDSTESAETGGKTVEDGLPGVVLGSQVIDFHGAAGKDRTYDLSLTKGMLYH